MERGLPFLDVPASLQQLDARSGGSSAIEALLHLQHHRIIAIYERGLTLAIIELHSRALLPVTAIDLLKVD